MGLGVVGCQGVVDRIMDGVVGELTMLDSGDVLRVDQRQLETVIPQPGGLVRTGTPLFPIHPYTCLPSMHYKVSFRQICTLGVVFTIMLFTPLVSELHPHIMIHVFA
jgi:hypothetical protein